MVMVSSLVAFGSSVTLIVRIVSQPPVVLNTVSIIDPGAVKICPSKVYGKPLAQTSRETVVVNNGSSATVMVLMVSQPPVVLNTVSIIDPAALNTCPSKVYGKALAQTSRETVVVNNGSSTTEMVLMVSQPPVVEATVSVMLPAALKTCPSKVYGKPLAQTSRETVVVNNGSSATVMVLMVSQPPVVEATVSVMLPAALNTCPSKVYGKALAQTSRETVVVSNGSSATVMVLMVSQPPIVLNTVSIIDPAALKICPSKVYGKPLAQTSRETVVVNNGSSATVMVLMVSQPPVVLNTVSIILPAALKI